MYIYNCQNVNKRVLSEATELSLHKLSWKLLDG